MEVQDAEDFGEAPFQIIEGCFYEYVIKDKDFCLESSEIVRPSKVNLSSGRITPNIYVGTLTIDIKRVKNNEKCGELKLEVQSVKTKYRTDYRFMLEEITEKCTELLLQNNSPVSAFFEIDPNAGAKTLYQSFAFLQSILNSVEFHDSVQKVLSSPVTKWKECENTKDIRGIKRLSSNALKQIVGASNRIELHGDHPLKSTLTSIPTKITIGYKIETVDTPENRFVKHALRYILSFIGIFKEKLDSTNRHYREACLLEDVLEQYINHPILKEILPPSTLPLNSPVLQRKEGYREILRVWLMFELAAKLVWEGGEEVYRGGKRDVAVLYEYWLFFKLLEIIKTVFSIETKEIQSLIKKTEDGLGLQLIQGTHCPIKGTYDAGSRKLNVEFSYNRTFRGNNLYPDGGSWTRNMRPDYTLSVWPHGIDSEEAEKQELITHIHFDAKYKVENLYGIIGTEDDFNTEKVEQRKGTYKRGDLLKMHTYKDAIRRTSGAYVIYPGDDKAYQKSGFHEIIPGLGAFAIRPSKVNDGSLELIKFLNEVVQHFLNRASKRERISLKTFETNKDSNCNLVHENLPEVYGENRSLLPDETFVLIGYYKSKEQLKWIDTNKLYNTRTGSAKGSLILSQKEISARYILLHSTGEPVTGRLFKVKGKGPRLYSQEDLVSLDYPNPAHSFYLVYDIDVSIEPEFNIFKWDVSKLKEYKGEEESKKPFAVSLAELMNQNVLIRG